WTRMRKPDAFSSRGAALPPSISYSLMRAGNGNAIPVRSEISQLPMRSFLHVMWPSTRQGVSTSHNGAAHVAFERIKPATSDLSWLNCPLRRIATTRYDGLRPGATIDCDHPLRLIATTHSGRSRPACGGV